MSDTILFEQDAAVTRITLNRPDEGNLISNAMGARLEDMFAEAAGNTQLIVLRGAGENFCLGRDNVFAGEDAPATALEMRDRVTEPALGLYAAFRRCPIPILGVIQGAADGVGCAVAALCDLAIAADDASFRVPEMDRDLPPTLVMSALADRVLRKAVLYLVYSRAEIDAETALRMGIVSCVVPASDLDDEAEALVATLAGNSPAALRAVKEYMASAPDMDRQGASDFASTLLSGVLSSR